MRGATVFLVTVLSTLSFCQGELLLESNTRACSSWVQHSLPFFLCYFVIAFPRIVYLCKCLRNLGNPLSDVILTALSPTEINAYPLEGAGAAQVETWEVTNTRTGNVSCTIKRSQPLLDCTDTGAFSGENTYSIRGLWKGGSSEPRRWGQRTLDEARKLNVNRCFRKKWAIVCTQRFVLIDTGQFN